MEYCQVEIQSLVLKECGKPASVKIGGRWYCEYHADALERALVRWADPDWIARQSVDSKLTAPPPLEIPRQQFADAVVFALFGRLISGPLGSVHLFI
jgi:hypothetical protein